MMHKFKSHIVCVDHKDISKQNQIKDQWRKDWFTIPLVQRVLRWDDFLVDRLTNCILVFVHRSAMSHDAEVFSAQIDLIGKKLTELDTKFSVGIVSAGSSAKHAISHQGRVCVLQTPFGMELSSLADRVGLLFSDISDAQCDSEKLANAWETFDKPDAFCESLVSLSILCQGYLATEALIESRLVVYSPSDDVGKALIAMGWAVANSERSLALSRDVAGLGLAAPNDLPGIEYWLGPFDSKNSREWRRVLAELQEQLVREFNGPVREPVLTLLARIEETISSKSNEGMKVSSDVNNEARTVGPEFAARAYSCLFQNSTGTAS